MSEYDLVVTQVIEEMERMVYMLLPDDIIVDGVIQHHIEGIRKRILETKEQQG